MDSTNAPPNQIHLRSCNARDPRDLQADDRHHRAAPHRAGLHCGSQRAQRIWRPFSFFCGVGARAAHRALLPRSARATGRGARFARIRCATSRRLASLSSTWSMKRCRQRPMLRQPRLPPEVDEFELAASDADSQRRRAPAARGRVAGADGVQAAAGSLHWPRTGRRSDRARRGRPLPPESRSDR